MKRNENLPLNLIEKMNARVSMLVSIIVLAVICIVFNRIDYYMIRKPALDASREAARMMEEQEEQAEETAATAVKEEVASVVAVGDNLITESLLGSGHYESGQWNYDHLYTHVASDIQAADVAVVSQETPFTANHELVSGSYPYATPVEVGDALVDAGFDVVSLATEYMATSGETMLSETMDYWNGQDGVQAVGVSASGSDSGAAVVEANGIRIAFLDACMPIQESTIGLSEGSYSIDIFEQEKLASRIAQAKSMADCVILCAHWGRYQEPMPTEYQKEWATFLLEQGVDVVLGSFPRVLNPYVTLLDEDGEKMLAYYSLGGFISTGDTLKQLLGGMASFTIRKITDGSGTTVTIENPDLIPLVMHYDYDQGEYGVYKLSDYNDTLASQHSLASYYGEEVTLDRLNTKLDEILSMQVMPSVKTEQLSAQFDQEGNMYTATGEWMEDTDSVTSGEYYESLSGNSE